MHTVTSPTANPLRIFYFPYVRRFANWIEPWFVCSNKLTCIGSEANNLPDWRSCRDMCWQTFSLYKITNLSVVADFRSRCLSVDMIPHLHQLSWLGYPSRFFHIKSTSRLSMWSISPSSQIHSSQYWSNWFNTIPTTSSSCHSHITNVPGSTITLGPLNMQLAYQNHNWLPQSVRCFDGCLFSRRLSTG